MRSFYTTPFGQKEFSYARLEGIPLNSYLSDSSLSAIKLIELHSHRYSLQNMSSILDRWLICFVCSTLLMCTENLFLRSS
ncbi:hypothetical protein AtNW77_Chr1g0040551 [Arabidopsis thaliana]